MVDDLFLKTFLRLTIKFYSGKTQLKVARRRRKKLISMALPPGIELVLGAVPGRGVASFLAPFGAIYIPPNLDCVPCRARRTL